MTSEAAAVQRHLDVLRVLEVNGRVEETRAADFGDVAQLFRTIGEQVGAARAEMAEFSDVEHLRGATHDDGAREQVARARAARGIGIRSQ